MKSDATDAVPVVAIIGLGYVGLPLALRFARNGIPVIGIDIDPTKVSAMHEARAYLKHVPFDDAAQLRDRGLLDVTTDFARVADVDAVIICVPTPLTLNREPDLSYILTTAESIAPHIKAGCLVILESTTFPGTTDTDLRTVLEAGSGLSAGKGFYLAFSPEREDPGNPNSNFDQVPKLVGGYTTACGDRAIDLYGRICQTVRCDDCRIAEAAKLLENIYRSVNIAMVNELKVIYATMGIDIWKVIAAAKTKPYGFTAFYPGPGLGGHCIPIDPFYLSWKAREFERPTRFIELAGEINTSMPDYVVGKVIEGLNQAKKAVNGSRILLVGLAYKPNVDDDRESPTYVIWDKLHALGADIRYFDPHIPEVPRKRRFAHLTGTKGLAWEEISTGAFDCAIICTAHEGVDHHAIAHAVPLVVDTRNVVGAGMRSVVQA